MDIEPFRYSHKNAVVELFKEEGVDSLALYSAVTFCPIYAVYSFVLEDYPDNEEAKKRLKSAKEFYGF